MSFNANDYIHESDRAALESLKAIPGFESLMKKFMKDWSDRQGKLRNMSSFIRISEKQLPKYYEMLKPICEKLGIEIPELYLMMDVRPNAFTAGESQPYIVITSGLLETMPEELIPTVLAHECGHIACHHVLYRTMGTVIFGGAAGTLGRIPFGILISLPMQVAFFYWMRCSEYSADRAAILCDGSADKMAEVCMRLAGFDMNIAGELNKEAFMEQAREYRKMTQESALDKTMEFYMASNATHPFMAVRALECTEWGESNQFREIKNGTYVPKPVKQTKKQTSFTMPDLGGVLKTLNPIPDLKPVQKKEVVCVRCGVKNRIGALYCKGCGEPLNQERYCPECHEKLAGDEKFCPRCGTALNQ